MHLEIHDLGLVEYSSTFEAMRAFTRERTAQTPDTLWLCQHPPVFTQGLAGQASHVLRPTDTPIVQSDRGGQISYHGPGQLLAYPLLDLRRRGYFVKEYVFRLEDAILRTLAHLDVTGHRVRGAPGIYVQRSQPHSHDCVQWSAADLLQNPDIGKVAALGVKVTRQGCYHGLSLNVAMDLSPFSSINPCGYAGLTSVDLQSLGVRESLEEVQALLTQELQLRLQ